MVTVFFFIRFAWRCMKIVHRANNPRLFSYGFLRTIRSFYYVRNYYSLSYKIMLSFFCLQTQFPTISVLPLWPLQIPKNAIRCKSSLSLFSKVHWYWNFILHQGCGWWDGSDCVQTVRYGFPLLCKRWTILNYLPFPRIANGHASFQVWLKSINKTVNEQCYGYGCETNLLKEWLDEIVSEFHTFQNLITHLSLKYLIISVHLVSMQRCIVDILLILWCVL